MNLTVEIESAEFKFRQILEDYFVSIYDERKLLSHGIDHHRRVWYYARHLLSVLRYGSICPPTVSPSKLIIACYLHDIGMSDDPGPRHGRNSREICLGFLEKNHLNEKDYPDVLDAIENHDRKEYSGEKGPDPLLKILSLADDLDAFGYTGIYRYSEIYLLRGISTTSLGKRIRENAAARFTNFEKNLGSDDPYVTTQRKRYNLLDRFFDDYDRQVSTYDFAGKVPRGWCGVVQLFMKLSEDKMNMDEFLMMAGNYENDEVIRNFIRGFKTELSVNKNGS